MTPIENRIRELLDIDFKEWLANYVVLCAQYEDRTSVSVACESGKNFHIVIKDDIMPVWRAVASAWLDDPEADRGEPHVLGTNQKNPWTRSDRPLPSKLSDKELDIRHRLAFGWKVDRGRHEDVKLPTKMHLEQVDSSMLDAWKGK